MRTGGLLLETIPPIHIPFRFFLTAPWMGVLAALAILAGAGHAFDSHWSPELLGATHLLTLGFMAMVMLGAMFQLVPVITGHMIPGGAVIATLVHLFLLAGLLCLAAGFQAQAYGLFSWAIPLLVLAFAIFLGAVGSLLARRIGGGDAIFSMRLAVLALLVTVGLGLFRAANYAGLADPITAANIANIHLAWGLGGWVLLLVTGVSYQVIPMFHVTPSYPTGLARSLPVAIFCSLLVLTFLPQPLMQVSAVAILSASAVVYASFSIRLLKQRKRRIPDITARFWHLSLGSLILAAVVMDIAYFSGGLFSSTRLLHQVPVIIGTLMVYGFAISVIMGMLQKIVPFLGYLHLQRSCMTDLEMLKTLPHMGKFIPKSRSRWQFRLHAAAFLVLLLTMITGIRGEFAALLMAADFCWLGYTLASASWLYRGTALRVKQH